MSKAIINLALKSLTFGLIFGSILFYFYGGGSSQALPLRITVAEHRESPLLILSTFADETNRLKPRYGYSITNTTEKKITAYAVQETVSLGFGTSIVTTEFTHFPAVKLLLGPHESKQEEGGEGRTYKQAPVEVNLIVDFVEFADGTRWGEDKGKSGDVLDGKRAGGRAALMKYREIFASAGLMGLEEDLAKTDLVQSEGSLKSAAWVDGFKQGVNIIKFRLAAAKSKGGNDAARRELNNAFDSTDGRREP
jgi:hypothetical protein